MKKIQQWIRRDIKNYYPVSLFLVALGMGLLWSVLIPLWQFPDEQAHFSQVQNYAELGKIPDGNLDLSQEIYESERLLGTARDERGNNLFTYNPDYQIDYAPGYTGYHELVITAQSDHTRTTFVAKESPRYPPLYYHYSALWYRLVYNADLLTRVFAVRFGSVILLVGIVWASYKLAKELFDSHLHLTWATTLAIAMHPMLVFVSSGINNDTLVTLLSTLLVWQLLVLVRVGVNLRRLLAISLLLGLGMLTKQTVYLLLPTIGVSLILGYLNRGKFDVIHAEVRSMKHEVSNKTKKNKHSIIVNRQSLIIHRLLMYSGFILVLLAVYGFYTFLRQHNQGFWLPYWPFSLQQMLTHPDLLPQLQSLLGRLYRETLPWYWGIYRWLSLILPLWIYRLIKIGIALSLVGWVKLLFQKLKARQWKTQDYQWLVLIFANATYVLGLIAWELSGILSNGFGHGIQGRYFFPLIASHMAFLVMGWWQLTPTKLRRFFVLAVSLLFASLCIYSLFFVLRSYYDVDTLTIFVNQLSQYKPWFAKWPLVGIYGVLWLATIGLLCWQLAKLRSSRKN